MKFRNDSTEETCDASIPHERYGALCCMRTAGHPGHHIALARDAGRADGVCWECRAPIGLDHRDDCGAKR